MCAIFVKFIILCRCAGHCRVYVIGIAFFMRSLDKSWVQSIQHVCNQLYDDVHAHGRCTLWRWRVGEDFLKYYFFTTFKEDVDTRGWRECDATSFGLDRLGVN